MTLMTDTTDYTNLLNTVQELSYRQQIARQLRTQ